MKHTQAPHTFRQLKWACRYHASMWLCGDFSAIIGGLCALFCYMGLSFIKHKLKWDNSLDTFSLHGIGGVWSGIATGLFASAQINLEAVGEGTLGEGLLRSGNVHYSLKQLLSIVICIGLSAGELCDF